jgi:hypothetical protein
VIKTPNSEIQMTCQRKSLNEQAWSSIFFQVYIQVNEQSINEADSIKVYADSFSAKLFYQENCDLDRLETLIPSKNNSFNAQMRSYFDEFVTAYNRNNLKQFFKKSALNCGDEKIRFQFQVK